MAEYEKKDREVLRRHGWAFHHHGRVDTDERKDEDTGRKVTVDGKIKSRHMANQIMKEAGADWHF